MRRNAPPRSGPVAPTRPANCALALLLANAACDASTDGDDPAAPFTVRDSAGVTIAESAEPLWTDGETWTLAAEPSLVIGGDPADTTQLLHRVRGVERLSDGTLVVANAGVPELVAFDSTGRKVWTVRGGEGPGEVSGTFRVSTCGQDTVAAVQSGRVGLFRSDGTPIRTISYVDLWAEPSGLVTVAPDCGSFLFELSELLARPLPTEFRLPYTLYWTDDEVVDTVLTYDGVAYIGYMAPELGGRVPIPAPWGEEPMRTVDEGSIYLGQSHTPEIRVVGRTGVRRIVRWNAPERPLTSTDRELRDSVREALFRAFPPEARPELEVEMPPLDRLPSLPERLPLFTDLVVDDEERLWVRRYPRELGGYRTRIDPPAPGDRPASWWIFDSDGRWLGSISVPGHMEIQSISRDEVIVVAPDALGVESVALYPILKPEG